MDLLWTAEPHMFSGLWTIRPHLSCMVSKSMTETGSVTKHHAAPVVRPGRNEVKPRWRWQGNIPTERMRKIIKGRALLCPSMSEGADPS